MLNFVMFSSVTTAYAVATKLANALDAGFYRTGYKSTLYRYVNGQLAATVDSTVHADTGEQIVIHKYNGKVVKKPKRQDMAR